MLRFVLRILSAGALVAAGWTAAKAQTDEPAFELVVMAPAGETTIQCVRGCDLAWVERGVNPNSRPVPTFTFNCTGRPDNRCVSGAVGGWLKR
jgi:hypothetical protein